jgi:hypothetical protein
MYQVLPTLAKRTSFILMALLGWKSRYWYEFPLTAMVPLEQALL